MWTAKGVIESFVHYDASTGAADSVGGILHNSRRCGILFARYADRDPNRVEFCSHLLGAWAILSVLPSLLALLS